MRELISIKCPLTGSNLVYIGKSSNGLIHFYEAESNQGIRYKRYRLDWSILEGGRGPDGDHRYFYIDGDSTVEVRKVGDKWLALNATEEEKQRALADHSRRMRERMEDMKFPVIKQMSPKLLADELKVVLPAPMPPKETALKFDYSYTRDERDVPTDINARPNVSPDDCPLVEFITGKLYDLTQENISEYQSKYEEELQVGDTVYLWDMGGWGSMSGRAGEAIFRGNEYVSSKLTRMS